LEHSHIMLRRDLATDLPSLIGVPGELEQVFLNLVLNAVEAMPEGGTLRVSTALDDDKRLKVEVTDTGHGIPPEHLDRIFEPFFSTKGEKGTGLGLSVSHGVIERHGGEIAVHSEMGKGTTFTVWLPTAI
jgi:two-component system NtrC family sensor kinase